MIRKGDFIFVMITAPNLDEAEKLATTLVEERLAACVNIVPGCRSVYRWDGELVKDDEVLMVVKTARNHFDQLEKRVTALHSYDVPEVVAGELSLLADGYAKFLADSLL